jgi:L-fuconolactonase
MAIIDSQVHAYEANTPKRPWHTVPNWPDHVTGEEMVAAMVSGACTLSRESYPFPDIWDPLARVFDAWGFERCLWGTDWTRAFAVVNYEQRWNRSAKPIA